MEEDRTFSHLQPSSSRCFLKGKCFTCNVPLMLEGSTHGTHINTSSMQGRISPSRHFYYFKYLISFGIIFDYICPILIVFTICFLSIHCKSKANTVLLIVNLGFNDLTLQTGQELKSQQSRTLLHKQITTLISSTDQFQGSNFIFYKMMLISFCMFLHELKE